MIYLRNKFHTRTTHNSSVVFKNQKKKQYFFTVALFISLPKSTKQKTSIERCSAKNYNDKSFRGDKLNIIVK